MALRLRSLGRWGCVSDVSNSAAGIKRVTSVTQTVALCELSRAMRAQPGFLLGGEHLPPLANCLLPLGIW